MQICPILFNIIASHVSTACLVQKQLSRKNCVKRTRRNFRQTAGFSLYISASKTGIEKRIRELLRKLS